MGYLFYAFGRVIFLFVEVNEPLSVGRNYLDMVAQLIAEAIGI
jgi:hypothetical protein